MPSLEVDEQAVGYLFFICRGNSSRISFSSTKKTDPHKEYTFFGSSAISSG